MRLCSVTLRVLVVVAGVAGLGASAADGPDPVTERRAITDPDRVRAGSFFAFHDKALAQRLPPSLEAQLAGNVALLRQRTTDTLAADYLAAYDGAASDELTVGYLRGAVNGDAAQLEAAVQRTTNTIEMPDGHRLQLTVARTHGLHLWWMRSAALPLAERTSIPHLAGRYRLDTEGDCPIAAGELQLVQRDFLLEGQRADRLLLVGAVGGGSASFILTETRHASLRRVGGRVVGVQAPDRPSERLQAALGQEALRLTGGGRCEVSLRPLR